MITEDVFGAAQTLSKANGNGVLHRNKVQRKHPYLLGGLVRCGTCGTTMTPSHCHPRKGERFFYYRCLSVIKMNRSACKVGSVPAKPLEDFVLKRLEQLSQEKHLLEQIVVRAQEIANTDLPVKRKERSFLAARLGEVEAGINNLLGVLEKEGTGSRHYATVMGKLDTVTVQRDEWRGKLAELDRALLEAEERTIEAEVVRRHLGNFLRLFSRLDNEGQKELLKLLIREVVYDAANAKVRISLRPLPEIWGDLDHLEGLFDYRKRWLRD